MRKPIIVGNWKMNKTVAEAVEFIKAVDGTCHNNATFGVGATFLSLAESVKNAKNLIVAAENCHFEDTGAFTGEVSVPMLQEIGVEYCIIGHSERRQMFGDTNETVNKKALRLLAANMTPILCIGETEAEFDAGKTAEVIKTQLTGSLANIAAADMEKVVIAYEPIWAIGTGKSATKEIAQDCCKTVRDVVATIFGKEVADKVRIQYGGSVKPNNIVEYMAMEDIDGALIGGASLQADSFKEIIEKTK
ncbi:MAG: triose-phosphate isomerase [Erysipelotrichaceae bacterium]